MSIINVVSLLSLKRSKMHPRERSIQIINLQMTKNVGRKMPIKKVIFVLARRPGAVYSLSKGLRKEAEFIGCTSKNKVGWRLRALFPSRNLLIGNEETARSRLNQFATFGYQRGQLKTLGIFVTGQLLCIGKKRSCRSAQIKSGRAINNAF